MASAVAIRNIMRSSELHSLTLIRLVGHASRRVVLARMCIRMTDRAQWQRMILQNVVEPEEPGTHASRQPSTWKADRHTA